MLRNILPTATVGTKNMTWCKCSLIASQSVGPFDRSSRWSRFKALNTFEGVSVLYVEIPSSLWKPIQVSQPLLNDLNALWIRLWRLFSSFLCFCFISFSFMTVENGVVQQSFTETQECQLLYTLTYQADLHNILLYRKSCVQTHFFWDFRTNRAYGNCKPAIRG